MKIKNMVKVGITSSLLTLLMSTLVNADTSGTVVATTLNVRQQPNTTSSVVDKAYYGEKVSIVAKEGNWYKIKLNETEVAYVASNFIKQEATTSTVAKETAKVNVPTLNFRSSPFINSDNVIGKLIQNDLVTILSTEGEWYFVTNANNELGYVNNSYIDKTQTVSKVSEQSLSTSTVDTRSQIVTYAKQFLGNPYVFGGTSLTNGLDCSSFTQQMLKKFGYNISRTSYLQIKDGTNISLDSLLPGDLVFYGFSGVISHVAMYIGEGKIIHASSPSTGIIISNMYTQGKKPIIGATRIIS